MPSTCDHFSVSWNAAKLLVACIAASESAVTPATSAAPTSARPSLMRKQSVKVGVPRYWRPAKPPISEEPDAEPAE